jgi:RNA polymerase sigma-70 factor (ECF subfamily)
MTETKEYPITAELFERYSKDILRYAFSILRNTDDAKDVLQDVFLKYQRFGGNFRGDCSYKSWLFTITRNTCYDRIKIKRNTVEIEELKYEQAGEVSLDDLISLNTALSRLSSAENEIIYLKDFERYTYREISLLLDISITNAKSRLFRAKKKLKKMLEDK